MLLLLIFLLLNLIVIGFQYDANCPSYFVDDLELCAIKHIYSQNNLLFRADNDLVTMTADAASITDACRCIYLCV